MDDIEKKEDEFYSQFLDKAIQYCKGDSKSDGIQMRQLVAAAGVITRQRQTRGAMKALEYQIKRDSSRSLPIEQRVEILESRITDHGGKS